MTEVRVGGRGDYVKVGKPGVSRLILVSKDLLQEALNRRERELKQESAKEQELRSTSLASMAKRQLRSMKSGPFLTDANEFQPRKMEFCGIPAVLTFGGKEFFIDPHY